MSGTYVKCDSCSATFDLETGYGKMFLARRRYVKELSPEAIAAGWISLHDAPLERDSTHFCGQCAQKVVRY